MDSEKTNKYLSKTTTFDYTLRKSNNNQTFLVQRESENLSLTPNEIYAYRVMVSKLI